jgi:hypothetical protein
VIRVALILASLYWEAGLRSSKPTVCFVGDALTARPARVAQIKESLQQFEQAANIRFDYKTTCTSQTLADGTVIFTDQIRVVIPNTTAPGIAGDVYNAITPVPGKKCPMGNQDGGGWSQAPNDYGANGPCLFNMHLGDDSFASAHFGEASGGATPFVNHTLHEFGHALGLSHEHERADAPKGLFSPKGFGGDKTWFITPYDRLSVMHYTWPELQSIAPGNFANTGLSAHDRLALHILYPEDVMMAEVVGTRILRTGETLNLRSGWEEAGAVMNKVAAKFNWQLNFAPASMATSMTKVMLSPGTFTLTLTHEDWTGRKYGYFGLVRVLTPPEFTKQVLAALPF